MIYKRNGRIKTINVIYSVIRLVVIILNQKCSLRQKGKKYCASVCVTTFNIVYKLHEISH